MLTTIKIVPQADGYNVVTKYRNGHADVEFFETETEATIYRDYEANRLNAVPLYWDTKLVAYVTVPGKD